MTNLPKIYLRQMELGPMENFVYLIGDLVSRKAFVIDPAWQVDTILNQASQDDMQIVGALVTHHHHDHTNGLEELLRITDCKVYAHKLDAEFLCGIKRPNLIKIDHGHTLTLGNLVIQCIHTPGHTSGSQCFRIQNNLVSGDTLFVEGCGRCDLPGGDPKAMYDTLTKKIMKMDDRTVLLPGHNYGRKIQSTLGDEKIHNPFMQAASISLKDFLSLRMGH